jgi:hypothetical protein
MNWVIYDLHLQLLQELSKINKTESEFFTARVAGGKKLGFYI